MKLIFHIDVNSAFLSWTACGLLEEGGADDSASCADLTQKNTSDPASDAAVNAPATTLPPTDIREIASVIGGSEKSRHGIVLAKSTLAKQYGSSQASHSFRPGANARVWLWCRQITSYTCENPTS